METPATVRAATVLWALAIAAGAGETALVVTGIAADGGLDAGVWVNVALRSIVYSGAALLVLFFALGRRWARWSLTGLISVLGLAAMVVPAALEMAEGAGIVDAFGSGGRYAIVFVAVRLLHLAAVAAATVLMFTRSANAFFASA